MGFGRVTSITYKGKRAVLSSFMDITEHKRMEDTLLRVKKNTGIFWKISKMATGKSISKATLSSSMKPFAKFRVIPEMN